MYLRQFKVVFSSCAILLLFINFGSAQARYNEQHIEVSLRMIGHQVLLNSDDSTSRVLPIIYENDQYRIQFESEFGFNPDELVNTVNQVIKDTKMTQGYFMEVEDCATGEVVYSFEINNVDDMNIIPCTSRDHPKSSYSFLFTLIEEGTQKPITNAATSDRKIESNVVTGESKYTFIILAFILMIGLFLFLWKKRRSSTVDPNMIQLGNFYFDKRNTELILKERKIELTSKEADLLLLLHSAVNETVERDVILNVVWGDEGDYVGRTVDVFISKLRKKLEADASVKIVNERGVGYKLVVEI